MRLAITLTALALVLAGCTGKDDPVEAATTEDPGDEDAAPVSPAATPSKPPASPKPSPSPTPAASPANATANASAPAPTRPETVLVEGDAGALVGVGMPDGAAGYDMTEAVLDLARAGPSSGLLTLTWTSQTPADASMSVMLRDVEDNLIASGSGPSPLVIEIPGEGFGAATELRGLAFPTAPGASAMYTVHFALSVTYA